MKLILATVLAGLVFCSSVMAQTPEEHKKAAYASALENEIRQSLGHLLREDASRKSSGASNKQSTSQLRDVSFFLAIKKGDTFEALCTQGAENAARVLAEAGARQ